MPPDRPRGSGLRSSILKCTCLLKRQYPSTLKVNENSDKAIDRERETRIFTTSDNCTFCLLPLSYLLPGPHFPQTKTKE